jgi:hypothetical protein
MMFRLVFLSLLFPLLLEAGSPIRDICGNRIYSTDHNDNLYSLIMNPDENLDSGSCITNATHLLPYIVKMWLLTPDKPVYLNHWLWRWLGSYTIRKENAVHEVLYQVRGYGIKLVEFNTANGPIEFWLAVDGIVKLMLDPPNENGIMPRATLWIIDPIMGVQNFDIDLLGFCLGKPEINQNIANYMLQWKANITLCTGGSPLCEFQTGPLNILSGRLKFVPPPGGHCDNFYTDEDLTANIIYTADRDRQEFSSSCDNTWSLGASYTGYIGGMSRGNAIMFRERGALAFRVNTPLAQLQEFAELASLICSMYGLSNECSSAFAKSEMQFVTPGRLYTMTMTGPVFPHRPISYEKGSNDQELRNIYEAKDLEANNYKESVFALFPHQQSPDAFPRTSTIPPCIAKTNYFVKIDQVVAKYDKKYIGLTYNAIKKKTNFIYNQDTINELKKKIKSLKP